MKLTDNKTKKDYYLEWSTIVDAPVTYGMSLEVFKKYYKKQYGISSMRELEERLKRVEEKGVSAHYPFDNLKSFLQCNRAGDNEKSISKKQIIEQYCIKTLSLSQ